MEMSELQMYDLTPQDLTKSILYVTPDLLNSPVLPYKTSEFDLALCSDTIFQHGLSVSAMYTAIKELCRIATEIRIFPLLDSVGKISDELGPLMLYLQKNNFGVEVRAVSCKAEHGDNALLRIWSQTCEVS